MYFGFVKKSATLDFDHACGPEGRREARAADTCRGRDRSRGHLSCRGHQAGDRGIGSQVAEIDQGKQRLDADHDGQTTDQLLDVSASRGAAPVDPGRESVLDESEAVSGTVLGDRGLRDGRGDEYPHRILPAQHRPPEDLQALCSGDPLAGARPAG